MLLDQIEPNPKATTRIIGSLAAMLVVFGAAIFGFLHVDRQLNYTASVESDNQTWVLAQIQVDVQRLEIALLKAAADPDAAGVLDGVRLAFDLLYSRVSLVDRMPKHGLSTIPGSEGWSRLAGPAGLVSQLLPLIDGPDNALRAVLPSMAEQVARVALPVREMVVAALAETMQTGDKARASLHESLVGFLVAMTVTVLAVLFLLATIYNLSRGQKRYARMLEFALHNLRVTIESDQDAVLVIADSNAAVSANRAGETMLGRAITEAAPLPLDQFLFTPDGSPLIENTRTTMECLRADGSRLPVEVLIVAANTAAGQRFRIAFMRDMTDQLERERKLARATELARKNEETKDRFLAVMSHEMRTPLSGLLSAVDLLQTSTLLDPQQARLVDIIRGCGLGALEQVNNILELARLSAKDANDYPISDFDAADVVGDLIDQYGVLASQRGNTIGLDTDNWSTDRIRAPLPLFRRVVNNLLSNAIKFTRNGTIDVSLASAPSDNPNICLVRLSVCDTGIGISEDDQSRIFKNFETLGTAQSQSQEGTGLGLGIVRLAVEAMGGTIAVQSRAGVGTRFEVEFPAETLTSEGCAPAAKPEPAQVSRPLCVLVAEDNDVNRALLERQLSRLGHRVTTACDGAEAIAAVERQPFDIILMDIAMPVLDGVAATVELQRKRLIDKTPVVALTAQAAPNRLEALREVGMAEVVIKPVDIGLLEQIMQALVHAREANDPLDDPGACQLIDAQRLEHLASDIGAEFLSTMLARFEADMAATAPILEQAVASGDASAISRLAHKAAGAAAVLTLRALNTELQALEEAAAFEPRHLLQDRCLRIARLNAESVSRLKAEICPG